MKKDKEIGKRNVVWKKTAFAVFAVIMIVGTVFANTVYANVDKRISDIETNGSKDNIEQKYFLEDFKLDENKIIRGLNNHIDSREYDPIYINVDDDFNKNEVTRKYRRSLENSILYVGGTGPGNYSKIQDAINDSEDGYTIYVYYGIYNESIVINKSVSLIGIGEYGERPVIDGRGRKFAVNITADGCTVKSFKIINYGEENSWYYYGTIINSINNVIENNTILCNSVGVDLFYSSNNVISGNTVSESNRRGIALRYSDNNTITENDIIYNPSWAVFLGYSCGNIISMNNISLNDYGIDVFSYSDNNTISYNNVSLNEEYGISIQGGSYNKVIGNNVCRNKRCCGIAIFKCWSSHNLISNNTVSSNNWCGIHVEGLGNVISRNNITHNTKCGIYLDLFGSSKINFITENNLIENGINAYFWVRILSFNIWYKNYWSDWLLPIPRPIFGKVIIPLGFFGLQFPWINFDWRPVITPYDI